LAAEYQRGDKLDQLRKVSEVSLGIQKSTKIASTLSGVKFGGFRKP
jgi:hypothetical protein